MDRNSELIQKYICIGEFNLECLGKLSQQGKIPLKKTFFVPSELIKFET